MSDDELAWGAGAGLIALLDRFRRGPGGRAQALAWLGEAGNVAALDASRRAYAGVMRALLAGAAGDDAVRARLHELIVWYTLGESGHDRLR